MVAANQLTLMSFNQCVDCTAINQEYPCIMVIYSFGGPSIALQISQLTRFPAYLDNLARNPKIKKLVLDASNQSLMLRRSFNLPWDTKHGVYELQKIMANFHMKPHDSKGYLGMLDFCKILHSFEYKTPFDATAKDRRVRLLNSNFAVDPKIGLPQEVLKLYALKPSFFIVCGY